MTDIFELPNTAPWTAYAKCVELPADVFFPTSSKSPENDVAKGVCAHCTVRSECRDAGKNEDYGTWGGITEDERAAMRKAGKR